MNILVINASPKGERSNTYRLTSAFLEGMQDCGSHDVVTLPVNRLDIKPCLGCFACWNKTPGKCCIKDDMEYVLGHILRADVIIWSFPLYYFSVPGSLKNLMDRQLPMVLPFMDTDSKSGGHPSRYDRSAQRHVVISTCGFYTAEGNYDGVNALFDHICGKGKYTTIYCGQGELFRVRELSSRTDEYLEYVRAVGREFANGSMSADTRQNLEQLLFPRDVFEAMADASWGVEKNGEKADDTLVFTRQMAALYNKASYPGRDIVLEMDYTDIGKRYQIILDKEGSRVIEEDLLTPTTTIETPFTVWKAIASGEISGQDALMQGKYRVRGDFNLMIYWDRYFGSSQPESAPIITQKPTSMALLLMPWILFWITTSAMDAFTAALITVAFTVLMPLVFYKKRMLAYDQISAALVTLCCIGLLAGLPLTLILPASYLGFGLLWTVNGFTRIPLTANYSVNDYGGETMLTNPLFLKTNRILTLCWGILYLLMSLWTVVFFMLDVHWIAVLNSLLPMVMSFFTIWFQKWYPAKVAMG